VLSAASGRRGAALGAAAAVAACLTVAGGATPARADSVRARELWVLGAVNAPAAWPVSQGAGVTVAVIDSGVNPDVPDLAGSVRPGPDLTGVGTPASNPQWGMHGTWMASLIAGHGHGGGSGIIGIAPQSRVLSIRVITDKSDPGYSAYQRQSLARGQRELADGISDAVRAGAGVISLSLGYGAPSRPVRQALQNAFARNVVVVASSGNSGDNAGPGGQGSAPYSFPADYPGVLGVGAVGPTFQPAAFSSENLSVQVAAPGVSVPAEGRDSQYWLVSGTSPACAIAAGVAALVKSRYPRLSDAQVLDAITTSAWHRPRGGYDQQVGFGTVDAAAALAGAGRLARSGGAQAHQDVTSAGHFGGGPAAVPAPPVPPRGSLALLAYLLLGLVCLGLVGAAALRLVSGRPPPRRAPPPAGTGDPPGRTDQPGPAWAPPRPAPPPSGGDPPAADPGRGNGSGSGSGQPPGTWPPAPGPPVPGQDGSHPGAAPPAGTPRFPRPAPSRGRHAAPSDRPGGRGDRS
jgi:type VII secretion-associated serine protease mycosin